MDLPCFVNSKSFHGNVIYIFLNILSYLFEPFKSIWKCNPSFHFIQVSCHGEAIGEVCWNTFNHSHKNSISGIQTFKGQFFNILNGFVDFSSNLIRIGDACTHFISEILFSNVIKESSFSLIVLHLESLKQTLVSLFSLSFTRSDIDASKASKSKFMVMLLSKSLYRVKN